MKFLPVIEHIKSLSTEKDIQAYLTTLKDNELWLRVLEMTYDPSINYWIKNIDTSLVEDYQTDTIWDFELCLDQLTRLSKRELTGDAAYIHALKIIAHCEEPELINMMLQRTFRMGIEIKTFNKAYGSSFLLETPYMRCGLLSEKTVKNIKFPAFSQLKADGQYIAMIITHDGVQAVSRQGKEYDFFGIFDKEAIALRNSYGHDIVLTGEMLVLNENGIANRQTGNGQIQKCGKGTGVLEEVHNMQYIVWDVIPYTSYINKNDNTQYINRFQTLQDRLLHIPLDSKFEGVSRIKPITGKLVNSLQEAYEHHFELLGEGEEGTILKSFDLDWKSGTNTKQLKLKLEFDCDVKIVGFKQGKPGTWNENILGSVICKSEDGILTATPGQWTEELRYHIWENQEEYLGQVITVTAHRITSDKKTGEPSLYLSRFKAWREGDKNTADTYERIKEIEASIMMLKEHK
jgi:hypothetical protein